MSRRAYNVLVLPVYKNNNNFEYCIFQREDNKIWQFIAGGGEDIEEPIETAYRETFEESGIEYNTIKQLKTVTYMPTHYFPKIYKRLAKYNIYVMPLYCFYIEVENKNIMLSDEHLGYKWLSYNEAMKYFTYDTDKTALWELASILGDNNVKEGNIV